MSRVQAMQAGLLQADSTWYMLKLSSMSTILREWNALHSVHNLKFKQVLLSAGASTAARRINPLQIPQVMVQALVARRQEARSDSMLFVHW